MTKGREQATFLGTVSFGGTFNTGAKTPTQPINGSASPLFWQNVTPSACGHIPMARLELSKDRRLDAPSCLLRPRIRGRIVQVPDANDNTMATPSALATNAGSTQRQHAHATSPTAFRMLCSSMPARRLRVKNRCTLNGLLHSLTAFAAFSSSYGPARVYLFRTIWSTDHTFLTMMPFP